MTIARSSKADRRSGALGSPGWLAPLLLLLTCPGSGRSAAAAPPPDRVYRHYTAGPVENRPGNEIRVCAVVNAAMMVNDPRLTCTGAHMLRQDARSGEVVQLAAYCPGQSDHGVCFTDECVPPGRYRYGLAEPFDCSGTAGLVEAEYYAEVEVRAPLEGCRRSPLDAGPTPHAEAVPWAGAADARVCTAGIVGACAAAPGRGGGGAAPAAAALLVLVALRRRRGRVTGP